eukprot:TRINITY_DN33460_c0_g1_i1.p1 TRINITY_DN33460_c0_g1~~TRINITY_DN33460_c0_g1_i1.p1  ORF type:complete len:423 (-),score=30.03 TRINITY_DN33460_c0_g1_i1:400-1668(-)
MAVEGNTGEPTDSSHDACLQRVISFRPLAAGFTTSFFVTLAVAGAVTFTATEYSKETDKIFSFYGLFNPCIFFDHYPAKTVAAVGIAVMCAFNTCFTTLLLTHVFAKQSFFGIWCASTIWTLTTITDANFINVFTTNLYPETNPDRRLHGAHLLNGTVLVGDELSTADVNTVILHTACYIVWVVGNILLSVFLSKLVNEMGWRQSKLEKLGWGIAMVIGWFGMFFHMASMTIKIIHGDGKVAMDDIDSGVQRGIIQINSSGKVSLWGWIPILYFRFLVPARTSVEFTFKFTKTASDHGSIDATEVLQCAFALFGFNILLGLVCHSDLESDDTTLYPVFSGMRAKPYAYFAAPLHFGAVMMIGLGVALTLVQQRLDDGKWSWPLAACGGGMFLSLFSCVLIVVEQERFTWIFAVVFLLTYAGW